MSGTELMVNLGCGTRLHHDWLNLDFSPLAHRMRYPIPLHVLGKCRIISETAYSDFLKFRGLITYCDLSTFPLPLPAACAKAVYHSNVLEHFSKLDGLRLLEECYRLLRPGGFLRIVVPDLELLIRAYLSSIDSVWNSESYDNAMHRLFDQMVRSESGGHSEQRLSLAARLRKFFGLASTPASLGELHKWMYDRHSLPCLLADLGFFDVAVVDFRTSRIGNFASYCLDNNADGSEYKTGMLYVEGCR